MASPAFTPEQKGEACVSAVCVWGGPCSVVRGGIQRVHGHPWFSQEGPVCLGGGGKETHRHRPGQLVLGKWSWKGG